MVHYVDETDARHCCLNVLNLLAQEDGVKILVDEKDEVVFWGDKTYEIYTVPLPVQEWAGMQSKAGKFDDSNIHGQIMAITGNVDAHCSLANCNDMLHMNFNQIADLIDAHWEEL
jgi:hypothetical protein